MTKPAPSITPDQSEENAQLRDTAAGPASAPVETQPTSAPPKATAPATGSEQRRPKVVMTNARPSGISFEDDPAKLFPNHTDAYRKDMCREVMCHVIDTFTGRTKTKQNTYVSYRFVKHEVVALPKWFAVQHPTRLIIKE